MISRTATILTTDSIEQHQRYLSARGLSSNTRIGYASDLRDFLAWRGNLPSQPMTKLDEQETMVEWLAESKNTKSPATVRRRKASIGSYTRFARGYEAGFMDDFRLPAADLRKPHPVPGLRESLAKLVVHAWTADKQDLACLISMGGYLGCRVSESRSLTTKNFDLEDMTVTIVGKGNKKREVPVSKNAWTGIRDSYNAAMAIYDQFGVYVPLISIADRTAREQITTAGIKVLGLPIASHDLRATFATETYSVCKDAVVVMRLMGHARIEDTLVYISEDETARRKAVEF